MGRDGFGHFHLHKDAEDSCTVEIKKKLVVVSNYGGGKLATNAGNQGERERERERERESSRWVPLFQR